MKRDMPTPVRNGQGLRGLPSVDRVLAHPAVSALAQDLPSNILTIAVREELDSIRQSLLKGNTDAPALDEIAERAVARALVIVAPSIKPVINATGVIIHTN